MMELLGEDSFRAAANARASRTIADLSEDIETLARDRARLLAIPGIGAKMADKITEFCETGSIREHGQLKSQVPPGLLELLQVPGLGPKTVRVFWQHGGITTMSGLEKAITDGSLAGLPRMGQKSVEKIKSSLAFVKTAGERLWLGRAHAVADVFIRRLKSLPSVADATPAGSLRRGKETIGDIDILVTLKKGMGEAARVAEAFCKTPGVVSIITQGENKSSVRFGISNDTGRWKFDGGEADAASGPTIQVDLRILPRESWGSGMMYFTGSKEHNIRLRERALKMGFSLNEWGLFVDDDPKKDKEPPQQRGLKPVAAQTEEEVYAKLKLPFIPPEIREDRGELDLTESPRLIEVTDIKAELHAHTTASDGSLSIEQLADEARRRGFHTIAVTDHSRSSAQANGLSVDRLLEHIDAIRAASAKVNGITILAGSEVDILADGSLDYPDEVLRRLDIVVASPHTALSQDGPTATKRLLAAISNPLVHILGHPTGRLVNRRAGLSPDMSKVIHAAKSSNVALEINAHWMRLDLRDAHVRASVDAGCLLAINTDAHDAGDFDNLRYGVATGRRGWLTPDLCINTWSRKKLHDWLKSKR